jgi:NodT family efflux transporter outer membrane factor (OMF) lipoprotein
VTPKHPMDMTAPLLPSASPRSRGILALCAVSLLAGCAVGPDYKRPEAPVPASYKENAGWKAAAPADQAARGPWWEVFGDPVLNDLEGQVETSNETIKQAAANYEAAHQIARSDRTQYLPFVSASASAQRSNSRTGQTLQTTQTTQPGQPSQTVQTRATTGTIYTAELEASWEPDLWGKVRRTVEADVSTAQADAASLALTRLSTEAALAQDYVTLRVTDDKIRLLEGAVDAYTRTLKITRNKYAVGVSARSDIITAQAQLDAIRAQLIDQGVQRAQFEHAIAVLVGKAPSEFSIARRPDLGIATPVIPPQLPSSLLERRPDVSAAEREAKAANAKIGIQTAAYYPDLSLTGAAGFEGSPLDKLFTVPFRFWTLGAQAADELLDWGQRHDLVESARASYEASAANYRQTVLTALAQVEDNLAGLRILGEEAQVQDTAVSEAAQASQIALNEYNAGTVDFTTVAAAEVTELNDRETSLGIHQSQLTASVALIQALGGGWTTADLPKP